MRFPLVIAGYEVDFEIVDTPVLLECDGWDHHGKNARGFRRDKERTAALTAAGRIVVPFTWFQIVRRPESTLGVSSRSSTSGAVADVIFWGGSVPETAMSPPQKPQ